MESSNDLFSAIPRCRKHRNFRSSPVAVNFRQAFRKTEVSISARKLAAGLWQWQNTQLSSNGSPPSSVSQLANGNVKTMFSHYDKSGEKIEETKDKLRKPITILRTGNGLQHELESSMPRLIKGSKEVAKSKWNPTLNEAFNNFTMIHSKKLLRVGHDHNSVVTTLLQLLQAQRSIHKLKAQQKSIKKNVEFFLQNLECENIFWKHNERQKIKATLDELTGKLEREKRSRERLELLNTKLVQELSEANSLVEHFMTNYEKEKKERELIEEVCDELAMQIGEDKAKLNVTLSESKRICEEVEEERKMMQMTDQWREERVQMKLVDAQFVLEDKYNELVQLVGSLQMFLTSKGAELDSKEVEDAKLIKQEVESVNIQHIMETI